MDNLQNKADDRNQKQRDLEQRITELAQEQHITELAKEHCRLQGYIWDEWLPVELEARIKGEG